MEFVEVEEVWEVEKIVEEEVGLQIVECEEVAGWNCERKQETPFWV